MINFIKALTNYSILIDLKQAIGTLIALPATAIGKNYFSSHLLYNSGGVIYQERAF